jgi:hypothetical protein
MGNEKLPAVQLPAALASKYKLVKPVYGGPTFDFVAQRMTVNLSTLTEAEAEKLIKRGYKNLVAIPVVTAKPTPAITAAAPKE